MTSRSADTQRFAEFCEAKALEGLDIAHQAATRNRRTDKESIFAKAQYRLENEAGNQGEMKVNTPKPDQDELDTDLEKKKNNMRPGVVKVDSIYELGC